MNSDGGPFGGSAIATSPSGSGNAQVPPPSLTLEDVEYPSGNTICLNDDQDPGNDCATIIVSMADPAQVDVSPSANDVVCTTTPNGQTCEIEVCPGQNTTYTISVSSPEYDGEEELDVQVSARDCRCDQVFPQVIDQGTQTMVSSLGFSLVNENVHVAPGHTLIIDQNTNIEGCWFKMGAGSKIRVAGNNTLEITASPARASQLFSCTEMWEGVEVERGELQIIENSLIEDAVNGVHLRHSGSPNGLHVENTRFNKNHTHIRTETTDATYSPFVIKTSDFTCEPLYSPGFFLLPPHNGEITRSGIFLGPNEQNTVSIGGWSVGNTFEGLRRGIVAHKASFVARNNSFQNIRAFQDPCGPIDQGSCPPICPCGYVQPGVAVLGYQNFSTTIPPMISGVDKADATVEDNSFYDCKAAVRMDNFRDVNVNDNLIDRGVVPLKPDHPLPGDSYINGQTGIRIKAHSSNTTANVSDNEIIDQRRGIMINTYQNITLPSIKNNTIHNPDYGAYNNFAMTMDPPTSSVGISISAINPFTDPFMWFIESNNIDDAITGIRLENLTYSAQKVLHNSIEVDPFPNVDPDLNLLRENSGVRVVNSNRFNIAYNTVQGSVSPADPQEPFQHKGMSLELNSYFTNLYCNSVSKIGEGFFFYGNNPIEFKGNTMNEYHRGIVLSNGGDILYQGNSSSASGNEWIPQSNNDPIDVSFRDGWESFAQNQSDGSQSEFYVNPGPTTDPPPQTNAHDVTSQPIKFNTHDPAQPSFLCPDQVINMQALAKDRLIRQVAANELDFPYAPEGSEWWAILHAYQAIKADSTLPGTDSLLIAFEDSIDQGNIGTWMDIDQERRAGNIATARALNSSISPSSKADSTFKAYNRIDLNSWAADSALTGRKISQLLQLARKCPITHGPAVYRSRSMLRYLSDSTLRFENDCPDPTPPNNKASTGGEGEKAKAEWTPHPADERSELRYELPEGMQEGTLLIRDIRGRLVEKVLLKGRRGRQSVELSEQENGLYFYEIRRKSERLKSGKLMIR